MKPISNHIFKLKQLFGRPIPDPQNKHYHNLKTGNTIEIDGKKYIKVKLRFVDSMNSDSTTLLLNLETENEFLKAELLKNQSISDFQDHLIKDLQNLNTNLLNEIFVERKSNTEKRKRFLQYENQINELRKINKASIQQLTELNQLCDNLSDQVNKKHSEIQHYGNTIKQLKLDKQALQNDIKAARQSNSFKDNTIRQASKKLNEQLKDFKIQIFAKEELCKQKDLLIKTLSEKIIEKEKKIRELSL